MAASVTVRARNETVTMDSTRREIDSDLLVIRVTESAERVDVDLIGDVDLGNSPELSAVLLEALDTSKPRIRCNLRLLTTSTRVVYVRFCRRRRAPNGPAARSTSYARPVRCTGSSSCATRPTGSSRA
jgi:hypothetical protein